MFLQRFAFALYVLLSLLVCTFTVQARASEGPGAAGNERIEQLSIGVFYSPLSDFGEKLMHPTVEALQKAFPNIRITVEQYSASDLSGAVVRRDVDLFVITSGFYAFLERTGAGSGATWLATRLIPQSKDPDKSIGAVFVARANDERFNAVEDMRTARVAAPFAQSFAGWIVPLGEIANVTQYPENFFGKNYFLGDPLRIAQAVVNQEVEIGILHTCELESLISAGKIAPDSLKVIGEKQQNTLACRTSTQLYPGLVFAARPSLPAEIKKTIAATLLSMPPTPSGYGWTVANHFTYVNQLISRFAHLPGDTQHTSNTVVNRYKYALLIGCLLLGGAVFYSVTVSHVVRRRTRELENTISAKARIETSAKLDRERLSQLERAGLVSELSSMIAHELRQPVASLINYADGLSLYLGGRGKDAVIDEATKEIVHQAERVSKIVERVRVYAKNRTSVHQSLDLCEVTKRAFSTFRSSSDLTGVRILSDLASRAPVRGDPLELELLIVNFLKNALQAVRSDPQTPGEITISLCRSAEDSVAHWRLQVRDNGPKMSDEKFQKLSQPVSSEKIEGLGLGLSITRVIAERHNAKIAFEQLEPRGISVTLLIAESSFPDTAPQPADLGEHA